MRKENIVSLNAQSLACVRLKFPFFLLVFTLTFGACNAFRKADAGKPARKQKEDDLGQTTPVRPPNDGSVLVDTVRWRIDPAAKPPIAGSGSTGDPVSLPSTGIDLGGNGNTSGGVIDPSSGNSSGAETKVSILLPFFTASMTETSAANPVKAQFALDFYAGAKLALDSLSTAGLKLNVNVFDSKGDFNALLGKYEVAKSDIILGPVEKENIPAALGFAARNNITFISPYFPTGDVEGGNPNFIQVKPGLKVHCENLVRHIRVRHQTKQVVLVGRRADGESARFAYFQSMNSELNKASFGSRLEEWIIDDETQINPEAYINSEGVTVFVLPSWNEAFVASFLKKLNASPKKQDIIVYGMPQWLDFNKSLNPLYETLKVRISSSTFIDANSLQVKLFKSKFQQKYGKQPSADAILGYDCMSYFGQMIARYGSKFANQLDREPQSLMHTRFNFSPVYRTNPTDDLNNNVSKVENMFVNVLKFQGGSFKSDD
jgi:hypothetical protein